MNEQESPPQLIKLPKQIDTTNYKEDDKGSHNKSLLEDPSPNLRKRYLSEWAEESDKITQDS